jgi:hypothetical protein
MHTLNTRKIEAGEGKKESGELKDKTTAMIVMSKTDKRLGLCQTHPHSGGGESVPGLYDP